jgi:hypothetical protein
LYLIGGVLFRSCDRLPFALGACPCCGGGIKFSRGWTWIDPTQLLGGDHFIKSKNQGKESTMLCECMKRRRDMGAAWCPVCQPLPERAGLLWIGAEFYPDPVDFIKEGLEQGISRRIKSIPRGFTIGKTYVYLAHIRATQEKEPGPGIFSAFKPTRIERIVKKSELDIWQGIKEAGSIVGRTRGDLDVYKRLQMDVDRGITLVAVPDGDPDHNK